jgi:hypothetical protein
VSHAASHQQMREALAIVREHVARNNVYLSKSFLELARARLAALSPSAPAGERLNLLYQLAKLELNHAQESEAIGHFRQAEELLATAGPEASAHLANQLLFDMGMAYLRLAETQNCCQRNTPDSCIVPIRGEGVHTLREGSTQASAYFQKVLRRTAAGDPLHLASRWLLNVAHMTLGEYPDGVPVEFLIPPAALESEQSFPRFPNIAAAVGVDTFSLAGGAIADDFDNDGNLDLVVSSWDPSERLRIFWNRAGRFEEAGAAAGFEGITGGLNLVQADYNNDGFVDILVLRGGWLDKNGRFPNSLLRNNGDRTFTDVTYAALPNEHYPTQTAAWADFDRDGDLDLYAGNESSPRLAAPCQLLRNNGDETFTDIAEAAGVTNDRLAKGVAFGDFDGDGWPDIYVSNYKGENRLYKNQGNGTFVDVAKRLGVTEPIESFPVWFWDFDNDGDLDLYVAAYSGGIAEVAAAYLGQAFDEKALARLYRNDGRGGFEDVAVSMNLNAPHHPMGANFGDLDNDGFLDFYLGTGWPELHEITPNAMYRNDGGERFFNVSTAGGFAHLQKGHAVVFADLDNDGDQDLFEQMGGFVPADKYHDVLYENPGHAGRWISLKLVGRKSNRSAIGARIHIRIMDGGKERDIYRWVGSGGSFGANPLAQHVGLGDAERIAFVEVTWPIDGSVQRFTDLPVETFLEIREGEAEVDYRRVSSFDMEGQSAPLPPLPSGERLGEG